MTPFHRAWVLALCDAEQRRRVQKWIRARAATARYRERHPEECRARVNAHRARLIADGYYRKGGPGFKPEGGRRTAKRRAYMAERYRKRREQACT